MTTCKQKDDYYKLVTSKFLCAQICAKTSGV